MYIGCAAQSAQRRNGRKKLPSLQSQTLYKDGSIKLPWYHLGSPYPYGHSLDAAAAALPLLTAGRFNGRIPLQT